MTANGSLLCRAAAMGILFILRPPRGGNVSGLARTRPPASDRTTGRLGRGGTKDVVSAITWARSCIKPTPSERDEISAEDKKTLENTIDMIFF